jgi:hypothetical protein
MTGMTIIHLSGKPHVREHSFRVFTTFNFISSSDKGRHGCVEVGGNPTASIGTIELTKHGNVLGQKPRKTDVTDVGKGGPGTVQSIVRTGKLYSKCEECSGYDSGGSILRRNSSNTKTINMWYSFNKSSIQDI